MTGGVGDQLSATEAAALWGVAESTWRAYVAKGLAPPADGKIGKQNWWWRSTVVEYERPGHGARTDLQARGNKK